MTLNLQPPQKPRFHPTLTVFGVGGAGGNAVTNMMDSMAEVNFVIANTDAQALENSSVKNKVQLGENITQGLGAGSYPEVGKASAEEAADEILDYLQGSNMVFITAGMGGGTGTGAAPVIARLAREQGILTVGVVTKPFHFEGTHRMRVADLGLQELQKYVDTLIVIPNQNLFRIADKNTTFLDAFKLADEVLHSGVRGITDLMVQPGLINLDFSDVRSVMSEMGKAMMGTGEASGENRAVGAAEAAIANPLLDHVSMQGARGVLINITGGKDMTLFEVDEAANRIREEVDNDANIIFGSTFDPNMDGTLRVSVVATGIDTEASDPLGIKASESPVQRTEKELADPQNQADSNYSPASSIPTNAFEMESPPAAQETSDAPIEEEMPNTNEDYFIPPEPMEPGVESLAEGSSTEPSQESEGNGLFKGWFSSGPRQQEEDAKLDVNHTATDTVEQTPTKISTPAAATENELEIPTFLRRKNN